MNARKIPILAALLVVAPGLYGALVSTRSAELSTLGRDQGIFQYFAWALRQGDVLYRDIRDVNGPLTTLVHLVFQRLGGEEELRFRLLDLLVTGLVFALVGACLPGLSARRSSETNPSIFERSAFALAAWVVCSAQYLSHLYWDIAQRETFADWFVLSSAAAQVLASSRAARRSSVLLALSGALAATAYFGKPTFTLFLPAQLLALWLEDEITLGKLRRFGAFAAGVALGAAVWIALLAIHGDLASFVKIAIFEAPILYRYIWARTVAELFEPDFARLDTALALVGAVIVIGLVATGRMKRRALVWGLLPFGAIASLVVQRKGFMYHYQPLGAAARIVWLALVAWAAERAQTATDKRLARSIGAFVLAQVLGLAAARQVHASPHMAVAKPLFELARAGGIGTEAYFQLWAEGHYYPWDMRKAAEFVQEHTRPDERVQVYGTDPYFLFLAKRLSATPYVYAYDLNVSAALTGGSGAKPDEAARQKILAMQKEHEADMLARFWKNPPGAFVFIEHAPMTSYWDDGPLDFETFCPNAAAFMNEHYEEAIRFGVVRVFLPKDVP